MLVHQLFAQTADTPSGVISFVDKVARTPVSQVVLFLAFCTILRLAVFPTLRTTAIHQRYGIYSFYKGLNELGDALAYAGLFVFLVIRPYLVQTFYIPSGSMLETLQISDYIVGNKFAYRFGEPKQGDIVIFKAGPHARSEQVEDLIKRLIGMPGDIIEVKDGVLHRNGTPVEEPYLREPRMILDYKLVEYKGQPWPLLIYGDKVNDKTLMPIAPAYALTEEEAKIARMLPSMKIPQGYYLMMGDNRQYSYDGRCWGLVPRQDIVAKSECIWMPLGRIGLTR